MLDITQLSEQEIASRLQNTTPATHDIPSAYLEGESRHAGVLIPFVRIEQAWHLLFIRRAEFDKDRHSGQVAFAGGKHEEIDLDILATALRETQEEIGIEPEHVRILGQLSHHHTITNFRVVPTVGAVDWPYELKLDTQEVAHAFTMPLEWLADEANHEIRYRQLTEDQEPVPVVYFDTYEGELLWGATARMVLTLIEVLKS